MERDTGRPDLRFCPQCQETKSTLDFHRAKSRNTLQSWCKTCNREYQAAWRQENKDKVKTYNFRVTEDEYFEMLADQAGLCAICEHEDATAVDHIHSTGQVRGILCTNCNVAIGMARENPQLLKRMAQYIETKGDYV